MTVQQLHDACKIYPYLLLRETSGRVMGVNSKVADIARRIKKYNDTDETDIVSYLPCDFNEYLNFKHPFVIA